MEVWQSPVYCTCLENRRVVRHREFESHRFRQNVPASLDSLTQTMRSSVTTTGGSETEKFH